MPINFNRFFFVIRRISLNTPGININPRMAIHSLFHTNATSFKEINFQRIAVNPNRKTAMWSWM